ncbi:MAG: class I SAM-dependent methyltransferase [Thiobacillaceae bacterium]
MQTSFKSLSRALRYPFHRLYAQRRLREYHAQKRSLEEVVDWAMHFGGGGYMKVKTLQIPWEITQLAKAVQAIKPKIIVEIGTARGGTLLIWSYLASRRVISCDLNDMHRQRPLFSRFPPPGSKCQVTLLSGNTHDPFFKEKLARELNGEKADFLFIDGDHTESGVEADYNDYKEFVRPGGLIAFHDIVEKQPLPTNQVFHFWKRLKVGADVQEFVADPKQCGFGIGLLRVPEV